jgi:hypothetical protein
LQSLELINGVGNARRKKRRKIVTPTGNGYEARLPPYAATTADNPTALFWRLSNVGPGAVVVYIGPPGLPAREFGELLPGHRISFQAAGVVLQSRDHLGTTISIETA